MPGGVAWFDARTRRERGTLRRRAMGLCRLLHARFDQCSCGLCSMASVRSRTTLGCSLEQLRAQGRRNPEETRGAGFCQLGSQAGFGESSGRFGALATPGCVNPTREGVMGRADVAAGLNPESAHDEQPEDGRAGRV